MARTKKPSDEAPVEILDEAGGPELGMDFGIVATTTLVLLVAVILVMAALGGHYDRGPFGG
jgi:hypothetical protein